VAKLYMLLSGGLDSAVAMHLLVVQKELDVADVQPVSVHYAQKNSFYEMRAAREICMHLKIVAPLHIDMTSVMGVGGLNDKKFEVPNQSYQEMGYGISPTYVPFRNGLMLSMLASQAMADPEAIMIGYGAHSEDAENAAYPDCSVDFLDAIDSAISIGTNSRIAVEAPLITMMKKTVVLNGYLLGTPMHLTRSCYKDQPLHCGICPTCISRRQAFIDVDIDDPTQYEV